VLFPTAFTSFCMCYLGTVWWITCRDIYWLLYCTYVQNTPATKQLISTLLDTKYFETLVPFCGGGGINCLASWYNSPSLPTFLYMLPLYPTVFRQPAIQKGLERERQTPTRCGWCRGTLANCLKYSVIYCQFSFTTCTDLTWQPSTVLCPVLLSRFIFHSAH
jgi:hypothetical protein